jgi:hypothetical protein
MDVDLVRSASLWQVKAFGLSRDETTRLVEHIKRPPELSRLVTLVPLKLRGEVFRHGVLAAAIDGRVSREERAYLQALGDVLGFSPTVQVRVERRVVEFVRAYSEQFDPLLHAASFAAAGPPLSVRVARALAENVDALWSEIRETGDLAVLLARRASGTQLDDDELARMKEQLIDVAKAVPSLAVFTLPGGMLLLPLLLRFLPFDLRPSSFRAGDRFRTFAKDAQDAITDDDLAREQSDYLKS